MSKTVEIIKKQKFAFDGDLALLDAANAEKIFSLHLSRCDDSDIAHELAKTFLRLGQWFEQKKIELDVVK